MLDINAGQIQFQQSTLLHFLFLKLSHNQKCEYFSRTIQSGLLCSYVIFKIRVYLQIFTFREQ